MGWFEDQVKMRKELDEQTFEDSFLSLAGIRSKKPSGLTPQAQSENFTLTLILSYYHHQMADLPVKITDFTEKLNYAMQPFDILYHKVEFTEAFLQDNTSPLIVFTRKRHTPVALLPRGRKGYYYLNYRTGRKVAVTPTIMEKFEKEALSFYRPLPSHKASMKEYIRYLRNSIRPVSVVMAILVSVVATGVGMLLPYLTKMLTGEVVANKEINAFLLVSVYVVAAATGLLLLKSLQAYVNARIGIHSEKSIREAAMMRLLSLPTSFFKKYNTGELTARFTSITTLSNTVINGIFVTLISAVMSVAYLFQLIGFAPVLILPVVLILLVSSSFTVFSSIIQKNYARKQLELSSKETGVTYEMINGIQKIRLAGSEKRVFAKWAKAYSRSARVQYNPPLILRLSSAISLLITALGNVLIYFVAARRGVSVPDYMAFTASYGVLSSALASLTQVVGIVSTIQPLYEMARPILTTAPEETAGKRTIDQLKGDIRLDDVCFRYNEKAPWILDHLSLDIHEGEYIAIVGPTGCGKSTFVRTLLGFEEPVSGHVYFDGVDIKDIDPISLRRNIGTVMQNGSLFHADIYSNIIISAPNLTEDDAWQAAEIADIAKDIRKMPMRMQTVISEGQGGISGGQKQRIMIARAIVHKPKILIFDEATSALDNKTQKNISDSIAKLNCTRIVIAHRLSTIKSADRILMLDGGRIIESGDYQSLIDLHGRFAELVERQRPDVE